MIQPGVPGAIDVHSHIFNGTDIPVERFVKLVRARKTPALGPLAAVLQHLAWTVAPDGQTELDRLETFDSLEPEAMSSAAQRQRTADRSAQYEMGVAALKEALLAHQGDPRVGDAVDEARTAEAIMALPPTLPPDGAVPATLVGGTDVIAAAIRFVLQMLQYRYENALTLLDIHGRRRIGLAFCHMLDFDWCLAGGRASLTPVAKQIEVMERITVLTRGRVYGFVPYDPFKAVARGLHLTTDDPLELVRAAIGRHGHVGVKMYLPMGFAPYGNAAKPSAFWDRAWIPAGLKVHDLGRRLDGALAALYAWCEANEVPILAHTSPSNGPADDFEALTKPSGWTHVPENGLRVDFGHFGDTEIGIRDPKLARGYAALMGLAGTHGAHFFTDSAYFTDAVHDPPALKAALVDLLRWTSAKGDANLAHRLMYGSDWAMLLIEPGDVSHYLPTFEAMFEALDTDGSLGASGKISDAFFARNAIAYVGLAAGGPARARLEAFHAAAGAGPPSWTALVDALADASA